jgi:hypothetical protein
MTETSLNLDKYPTDVKLLLCQLVYDSREENNWQDIKDRFINHPIVTKLNKIQNLNLSVEDLPILIVNIVNTTIKDEKELKSSHKRSGGRKSKEESIQNSFDKEINLEESKNLEYFQTLNSNGRDILSHVCTVLHHLRVDEIKNQLETNKEQFAALLKEIE